MNLKKCTKSLLVATVLIIGIGLGSTVTTSAKQVNNDLKVSVGTVQPLADPGGGGNALG